MMEQNGIAMQTFSQNGDKYLVLMKYKPRYSTICFKVDDEDVIHNKGVNSEDFHLSERFRQAYTTADLEEIQKSEGDVQVDE